MVNSHQGDQPLTLEEAAQQMKDAWSLENQRKIAVWNDQALQDQATQDELGSVARKEEEARQALQEEEEENLCKEAEKKKLKLEPYNSGLRVGKWIQPRPSSYALNKISNLEYVELDYFTPRACREAAADPDKSVSQDTLAFTQVGDTFAIWPMAATRPSKHIRNNEDLSWEDMLDAKNAMLDFMVKSGVWPDAHAASVATFFFNLEHHKRKGQKNGKMALLLYQGRVRREWFDALKRGQGFNIELIEEELLCSCAEEVNDTIRDRENAACDRDYAIRDKEFDQVRGCRDLRREPELTILCCFFAPHLHLIPLRTLPPAAPLLLRRAVVAHSLSCTHTAACCHAMLFSSLLFTAFRFSHRCLLSRWLFNCHLPSRRSLHCCLPLCLFHPVPHNGDDLLLSPALPRIAQSTRCAE